MTTIRKLISMWMLTLVASLFLPLTSVAAVLGTTYDTLSATTTASATTAEHTTATETARQSIASSQTQALFGQIRLLFAPKTTPTAGQKLYRVYGGDSAAGGASWSPIDPSKVSNYRNAAGLPSGGASGVNNTGRFVIEGRLTDPSKIIKTRSAVPLDGNVGGISEYIIPNWMDNGAVKILNVGGANPTF